jgi:hypothetical protein
MKMILRISVLLNLILLGGVVLLWWHPRTVTIPAPAAMVTDETQTAAPVVETIVAPFRWSQLSVSNDYRSFVANLRAAGCPESTVEDIVQGNVGRAFSWEREKLQVDASEPGPWSDQAQVQTVAYLLGKAFSPATQDIAHNQPSDGPQSATASMTAFLQNADLAVPGMTPEQVQRLNNLRDTFLAQLQAENDQDSSFQNDANGSQPDQNGAGNRNRNISPAAQARRQAAEDQVMMGSLFGIDVENQYEQFLSAQRQQ